jgi:hypothetical protein
MEDSPQMQTTTRPRATQPRTGANPNVEAPPLKDLEQPRKVKTGGRPKKLARMPKMDGLTEAEQYLFDGFIQNLLDEYPDMSASDYRIVFLAAIEYIEYLRVAAEGLRSHRVLAMSRQHPGVNMRALLDQLSATRKQRVRGKSQEPEEAQEIREMLLSFGKH